MESVALVLPGAFCAGRSATPDHSPAPAATTSNAAAARDAIPTDKKPFGRFEKNQKIQGCIVPWNTRKIKGD
ncbi:MAG: hypothetical protein WCZ18_10760 [Ottowia sp.]|nr:hypothetical protein [Ottowia sp.]